MYCLYFFVALVFINPVTENYTYYENITQRNKPTTSQNLADELNLGICMFIKALAHSTLCEENEHTKKDVEINR